MSGGIQNGTKWAGTALGHAQHRDGVNKPQWATGSVPHPTYVMLCKSLSFPVGPLGAQTLQYWSIISSQQTKQVPG